MEMISYPASKRIKNYLVVLMLFVKDCRNVLHVIYYKQKLLIDKLNIYLDRHYSRHWILKNGKPEVLMTRFHQWRGNTHIYNYVMTVTEHMNKRWGQKGKDIVGGIMLLRLNNKVKSSTWEVEAGGAQARRAWATQEGPLERSKQANRIKHFMSQSPNVLTITKLFQQLQLITRKTMLRHSDMLENISPT